jgi:hypothetical protein
MTEGVGTDYVNLSFSWPAAQIYPFDHERIKF